MSRPQRPSPIGEALTWASRIIAIGLTMFVPGVAGDWLDARLGTRVIGPAGFICGLGIAVAWLARLAAEHERRRS